MTPEQAKIVGAQSCLDRMEAGVREYLKRLDTVSLYALVELMTEAEDTRETWRLIESGPEYLQQVATFATLLALTREQIRRAEEVYGTPNGEKNDGR